MDTAILPLPTCTLHRPRTILAIETSCDDTSVAVVRDGRHILSNVMASQVALHNQYGGIIPELAARQHMESINAVVQAALDESGCSPADIDAVACTMGPGLLGSLLIGCTTAKVLAWLWQKPLIGVNHLQGHVASNYLASDLEPPFLCLLVSGGHTQFWHVASYTEHHLLGETLDDAVGEVYDKVARTLGLSYLGGPIIDTLAQQGTPCYTLPIARTKQAYDTSFSGLKTASLRLFERLQAEHGTPEGSIPPEVLHNFCATFQHTAVRTLLKKLEACWQGHASIQQWAIAGGVSANSLLRSQGQALAERCGVQLHVPKLSVCTDNAAMIAAAAYYQPLWQGVEVWEQDIFARGSAL